MKIDLIQSDREVMGGPSHLLILSALLVLIGSAVTSSVNFKKCTCVLHDNAFIHNATCSAKAVSRKRTVINIDIRLSKEMNSIFFNGVLYKKTVVTYRPFLVNVTEDFCKFMENNTGGFYLRFIAALFRPYSNLNHTCPYTDSVIVKNMGVDANSLVAIWPEGVYRLDLHILAGKTTAASLTIKYFFEVK